jgi:hypothetical protein
MTALYAVTNGQTSDESDVNQYRTLFRAGALCDAKNGYGATGDGATDDTVALQATIDAAAVLGGIAYLPPGTYITTTLTLPSKVELVGAGISATVLKLKASTNAAVIQTTGFAALTGGGTSGGTHSWAIRNLSIDGNKANNTSAGYGIRAYSFGYALEHVRVHDCKNDGVYSEWGSALGATAPFDMMASVRGVHSLDNGGDGFNWKGPHDSVFVDCAAYRNAGRGFASSGDGNGMVFIGCHSYGLGQTWAFWLEATGSILVGCTAEGAGSDATTGGQVFAGANDNSIFGGHIYSAGAGTPASSVRGIVIGDGTHTNIAGTNIDTKVTSCHGGAVVFGSESGSLIRVQVYGTSGAAYSGTVHSSTEILATVSGGATTPGNRLVTIGLFAGANAKMGTDTLTAGKCQVYTSAITANSVIFLTVVEPGGTTGALTAVNIGGTDRAAGEWFFVSSMKTDGSLQNADTSTFNWLLIEAM